MQLAILNFVSFVLIFPATVGTEHGNRIPQKLLVGKEQLSVLMLSTPMPGHVTPVLAFGEELVRRGHHVTLCTTLMKGNKLTETKSSKAGVEFFSAGWSYFSSYDEYQTVFMETANRNFSASLKVIYMAPEESKRIGLAVANLNITKFNIIIATELLAPLTACISKKWNIFGMVLSTTFQLQPHHLPTWPFPPYMAKTGDSLCNSDQMGFTQRFLAVPFNIFYTALWKLAIRTILYYEGSTDCSMISSDYAALYPGVYAPQVVQTAVGFEYPRPLLPLSHYVGPVLSKSTSNLPSDLQVWLESKQNRSVVLVSMGSIVSLTEKHAEAIVKAASDTGYSILWSLRKSNQYILKDVPFSVEQVKVSEWLPQLAVVEHPSIAMALLHGGLNSVNEALYHRVPVIAVPFVNDQGDVAARLQHSGAGIWLRKEELQTDKLIAAFDAVKSGKVSVITHSATINYATITFMLHTCVSCIILIELPNKGLSLPAWYLDLPILQI